MRLKKKLAVLLAVMMLVSALSITGVAAAAWKDGSYSSSAKGFGGTVSATVKIKNGRIASVTAKGPNETDGVGSKAIASMPSAMVKAQRADVDTVSGATTTSKALISAVKSALRKAEKAAQSAAAEARNELRDGVYAIDVNGRNGWMTVTTTFENQKIARVEVGENRETEVFAADAIKKVPAAIVENNSVNVDVVTGASITSNAILTAVQDAIAAAGGSVDDYMTAPRTTRAKDKTVSADVVVIGGGASGIMAATNAAEDGAKVILLEKTAFLGGASLQSFAVLAYDTQAQLDAGVDNGKNKFIADWIVDKNWRCDASVLRRYISNTGAAVDYLNAHGFTMTPFGPATATAFMLPGYATRRPTYVKMLKNSVIKSGGSVYMNTTGQKLLTDKSGAVVGVEAVRKDGSRLTVKANSVVIATGGYAGDKEWVEEVSGFGGVNGNLGGNIGEGLKMAWEVGAQKPLLFGGMMLHQTLAKANLKGFPYFETRMPMILTYVPSLLNVNTNGARFRDEAATLTAVAAANTSAFSGPYHYVVLSRSTVDKLREGGLTAIGMETSPGMPPEYKPSFTNDDPWTNIDAVLDAMVEGGWGYKGDTLEELARAAGMDEALFADAYRTYNEMCRAGEDTLFMKDAKYMIDLGDEGPFYVVTAEVNSLGTLGGLVINDKFMVLDDDNAVIPGLFAVGVESEGVLYNDTYVGSGAAMSWAFTSGMLGGREAAAYARAK